MRKSSTSSRPRPVRTGRAKSPAKRTIGARAAPPKGVTPLARALAGSPLLRGTPLAVARELLGACPRRELVDGQLLLLPTQPNTTLFLLLRGRLHVLLGQSQDTIVQMLPGTCVGEMSIIDGGHVSAPVMAAESSTLLAIDARRFRRLVERYPVIARNLLGIMAQRVRKTNTALRASIRAHEREGQLARLDPLTAAHNRRWLDENLPHFLERAQRGGAELVIGMFDIDHFKKYNDTWGHAAGDAALQAVARAVRERIRSDDRLCRYGGEEFCLFLPGTPLTVVPKLAERLLQAIGAAPVRSSNGETWPSVTASLGIAVSTPDDTPEILLRRADRALYRAKHDGRNCFVLDRS